MWNSLLKTNDLLLYYGIRNLKFSRLCENIVLFTLNNNKLINQWMTCHGNDNDKFIAWTNKLFIKLNIFYFAKIHDFYIAITSKYRNKLQKMQMHISYKQQKMQSPF